jgi:Nucleotidyl transferase AbiEii toxin, Type IV TA system
VNPLFTAADEVQDLCRRQGWEFCFIGGLAVLRWGEPRLTRDIDLTILASFGNEEPVIEGLLSRFAARLDNAREFARRHRVALLTADNGVPINVALGALDFEERAVQRASEWDVDEATLFTCSAEDLIVHKVFAGRDQDWVDIAGVVQRQQDALDQDLILTELPPLLELKGCVSGLDRLRQLLER